MPISRRLPVLNSFCSGHQYHHSVNFASSHSLEQRMLNSPVFASYPPASSTGYHLLWSAPILPSLRPCTHLIKPYSEWFAPCRFRTSACSAQSDFVRFPHTPCTDYTDTTILALIMIHLNTYSNPQFVVGSPFSHPLRCVWPFLLR